VDLELVDVEPLGRPQYEHHLIRLAPVAAVVLRSDEDCPHVALASLSTPGRGRSRAGSSRPASSHRWLLVREVLEETGCEIRTDDLAPLAYNKPVGGMSEAVHHVYLARNACRVADPVDTHEADRNEWWPLDEVQQMLDERLLVAGVAVTGLLQLLSRRPRGAPAFCTREAPDAPGMPPRFSIPARPWGVVHEFAEGAVSDAVRGHADHRPAVSSVGVQAEL
jgi:hypothetical protein